MKSFKESISTEPHKRAFETRTIIVFYFNLWHGPGNDFPIQGLQKSQALKRLLLSRLETSLIHKITLSPKRQMLSVSYFRQSLHTHGASISTWLRFHKCLHGKSEYFATGAKNVMNLIKLLYSMRWWDILNAGYCDIAHSYFFHGATLYTGMKYSFYRLQFHSLL